jgi:hypothetical protein
MPSSLNGTGITFNDGTTQSTAAVGGGGYNVAVFTSSGTWTKPAGLKAVKVTVIGAGGNGGTGVGDPYSQTGISGGGGGGSIESIQAPAIPGPVSVTVGTAPAKTSSFGAFLSATGGVNGPDSGGPSAVIAGGAGSGGNINLNGESTQASSGRGGGASALGFGYGGISISNTPGGAGVLYGGGGAGGIQPGNTPAKPGGAGAAGVVIVEEFY